MESGIPVIASVRVSNLDASGFYNHLPEILRGRPAGPEDAHAILVVGVHPERDVFLVNDPASFPLMTITIDQLETSLTPERMITPITPASLERALLTPKEVILASRKAHCVALGLFQEALLIGSEESGRVTFSNWLLDWPAQLGMPTVKVCGPHIPVMRNDAKSFRASYGLPHDSWARERDYRASAN